MKVEMHGSTNVGRVRKMNQDSIVFDGNLGFGVVADGIGGRPGGEIASDIVTRNLKKSIESTSLIRFDEVGSFMLSQVDKVNKAVLNYGRSHPKYAGLGTTVNFLYFTGDVLNLCHVGDSRTYLFYKEHMFQLTVDHNLGTFLDRGLVDESKVGHRSKPSALMRAIGLKDTVESDLLTKKVKSGEIYITSSDGLFDMVEDIAIRRIISEHQGNLEALPTSLIAEANKNGGVDNITVLVTKVL